AAQDVVPLRSWQRHGGPQRAHYGALRTVVTAAASANEETKGARSTAATMNAATRRSVSKRTGASLNQRTPAAARRASLQLVVKSTSTRDVGHPVPSSATRWAGKAASR